MLTKSKSLPIYFEKDKATRDTMIDKLSEADAKAFLKLAVDRLREASGANDKSML